MAICKTTHHVLRFTPDLEESLSKEESLESVMDIYFGKLKKEIKKCPSAYFYALINLDRFAGKSQGELQKCRDLFVAKLNQLPKPTESAPSEGPVQRMNLLQQYSIALSSDKFSQLKKKSSDVLADKDFRKKLLIDFIHETTEDKDQIKAVLKELMQRVLKDKKFMASSYKHTELMERVVHDDLFIESLLDKEDVIIELIEDFKKNPLIFEKRKEILERLFSELTLYYEKKHFIKSIFKEFINAMLENECLLGGFKDSKDDLRTALENQELLDSFLRDEEFLASMLSDEEFLNSLSIPQEGIDILNKILFKLSLAHEKIDDSFIYEIVKNCSDKKAKFFLVAIIKECLTAFSSRIGFTNTNIDQAKQTIQSLIQHIGLSLKEKTHRSDLHRDCKLIYKIISNYGHRALFEKQLDAFLHLFIKKLLVTNSENLDSSLRKALTSPSFQERTLTEKISIFERLTELPNFEQSSLMDFSNLPVLSSSIRVLSYLLPVDKFFLENPKDLLPAEACAKQKTHQFLFPLPRLAGRPLIDLKPYLEHRFPKDLLELLVKNPAAIEVYVGNKQQFDAYIEQNFSEYHFMSEFKSPSSFRFFIYTHKQDPNKIKIFLHNITSPSRLTHLGYILSLSGLKSECLLVSGSFEDAHAKEKASLEEWSKSWDKQKPPKVLFVGTTISPYLEKTITIRTDKPTPSEKTLCKGSYLLLETQEKQQIPVLSFSMPNGELAGLLTEFCLE